MAIDRKIVMTRAHLIARRFIGVLPNWPACMAYGMRCAWADEKARAERREAFKGLAPRALTAKQIAESRYYTRRAGASWT